MIVRLLLLGCLATTVAWADTIDSLFQDAPQDTTADLSSKPDTAALNVSPTRFSGSTTGDLGGIWGEGTGSAFYALSITGNIDSRPNKWFALHGTVTTTAAGLTFTALTLGDVYIDYNFQDRALIRAGRQTITWGQGRMFNPGNFVSESKDSTTFKVDTPLFGQNLTLLAMGYPTYIANVNSPTWREFVYCGQVLGNWGPFGWGLAGRDHPGRVDQDLKDQAASGFVKTNWVGVDWFTEGIWTPTGLHYLAGFFWDSSGDWNWKLQGEVTDKEWGAGIKTTAFGYTWGSQWEHSRTDSSGTIVSGVETTIADSLTLSVGVPWIYGKAGSEYVVANPDPGGRLLAVGLKMTLEESF